MCIQIAYLAQNLLEETEDFTEYLASGKGKWAMQYVDRAETLWDECKQFTSDSDYEDLDGIEQRLYSGCEWERISAVIPECMAFFIEECKDCGCFFLVL